MAANTHPSLVLGNSSVNSVNTGRPLFASASVSVGGGDWASEVLSNVVPDQKQEEEEPKVQEEVKESPEEQVRKIVLEKKRLFHSQRCLELKNLPEGVTEQVSSAGRVLVREQGCGGSRSVVAPQLHHGAAAAAQTGLRANAAVWR